MAGLVLHHIPGSRSLRVRWLLEELGVDYRLARLSFARTDLRSDEYLARNPFGLVPTLEDGDCVLFESGAILQHLLETRGGGRLAPAIGDPARGEYLSWFHWAEAGAMPPLSDYLGHKFVRPEPKRIAAVVEDAERRMRRAWDVLEHRLEDREWIATDTFSAADIVLGVTLRLARAAGALGADHPRLLAYLERLEARPALVRALAD